MDPTRAQVLDSIKETGVTYPIVLDPGASIGALYAIEAHPTSLVLDARGVVRYVNVGYLKGEEKGIERAIKEALGVRGGS